MELARRDRQWTYQWRSEEFTQIAHKQQENVLAREANCILICDTDVLATGIWHARCMGCRSPDLEAIAASHRHDLCLLKSCDLPFVQMDCEMVRRSGSG